MIEHRRIKHPSNKKCNKFPACERGERCLYKHEGAQNIGETQGDQSQDNTRITCRSCQTDCNDKNDMMTHRKIEHLNEVKDCKNIMAGLNCRKGTEFCWYRHDRAATNSRSTPRNNMTVPAYTLQNFPYGPTPQGAVVGQDNAL